MVGIWLLNWVIWVLPSLGVYAYTHWEWGQFLGALTRGPVASIQFLCTDLSLSTVAQALHVAVGGFPLCWVLCFPLSEQRVDFLWSSLTSPPATTTLAFRLDEFSDPSGLLILTLLPSKLLELAHVDSGAICV